MEAVSTYMRADEPVVSSFLQRTAVWEGHEAILVLPMNFVDEINVTSMLGDGQGCRAEASDVVMRATRPLPDTTISPFCCPPEMVD